MLSEKTRAQNLFKLHILKNVYMLEKTGRKHINVLIVIISEM